MVYRKICILLILHFALIIICYVNGVYETNSIFVYMCAVSLLFFSTLDGDITNDVFRGFVKNFVAVAFQSVWISNGLILCNRMIHKRHNWWCKCICNISICL